MNKIVRVLFAIFIPPVAVYDKGWDKLLITTALWMTTGIGGNLAAFYFLFGGREYDRIKRQYFGSQSKFISEKNKRPPQPTSYRQNQDYIELADGDVLEVVDTYSETISEKNKRPPQPTSYRQNQDYIELADGDVLEVVDTDMEERRQRLRNESKTGRF